MFKSSSTGLLTPPAGSRLLVQESVFRKVVKKLRDCIQTLRIGNPLDKNTDIGAINNQPQLEKIRELVQSGADEGAGKISVGIAGGLQNSFGFGLI